MIRLTALKKSFRNTKANKSVYTSAPADTLRVPGRVAMTCCADDTTFLGYVCRSDYAPHIKEGSWVEVTAKVAFENRTEYQGEGIVLYASDVKECEPLKEEMVYFN